MIHIAMLVLKSKYNWRTMMVTIFFLKILSDKKTEYYIQKAILGEKLCIYFMRWFFKSCVFQENICGRYGILTWSLFKWTKMLEFYVILPNVLVDVSRISRFFSPFSDTDRGLTTFGGLWKFTDRLPISQSRFVILVQFAKLSH